MIVEIIAICYHACFADFWRGVFFGRKHRKHIDYIRFYDKDNYRHVVCDKCKTDLKFHQRLIKK